MNSATAVRAARLGGLLRQVEGAESEADYCDFLALIRAYSRGVDLEGARMSALKNIEQLREIVKVLDDWRGRCISSCCQDSRGAARLRGFITEDLYKLFQQGLESFEGILKFCATNDFDLEKLRCTPPFSAVNETVHALLRAVSKNVVITQVARYAEQILEVPMILSDDARTWPWGFGVGSQGTYERSSFEVSVAVRSAALAAYRLPGAP